MHLKTLTLRGFKSFASATTLSFEPGITCVVGPNGSGKSNVVDALAWVMGEQGAKSLRGGSMEDVIFAGTAGRAPLGRAEVALTIDNTDGALPIEYTEVTISRTLFRTGGSDYAINGHGCRLLDIQELLSDSGLGREMHVIVGQGRLDAILRATPEERRGFVEEAAGVLKHRRRKEKALRKLDAMQANMVRVGDLTAELRRQMGPLGRQAEMARKAAVVQADLRDAKARLLADELAQLTAQMTQELADETALRARRDQVEAGLDQARSRVAELELAAAQAAPYAREASEVWYRLSALRERLRGTVSMAADRARLLGEATEQRSGTDPDDLAAQAARIRAAEAEILTEVDLAKAGLTGAVSAREQLEDAAAAAERDLAALLRAAADRREGVARLAGKVAARRSRLEATAGEIGRLREALDAAERRGREATSQFTAMEAQAAGAEAGEVGLDAAHEAAAEALDTAQRHVASLVATLAEAEKQRDAQRNRAETLALSLLRKDGAGALLAADRPLGALGSVAAMLAVAPDDEEAIVAALGSLADAVVVESVDAAVDAIRYLRETDAGRASLVVAPYATSAAGGVASGPALPHGASWAVDLVLTPERLTEAARALLAGVVVVDDLATARALLAQRPELTVATRAGDVLAAHRASGGSASAPSALHLQAALDEARTAADAAGAQAEATTFALVSAREEEREAAGHHDETLALLHESDAALAAVAEQLGHLGSVARAAAAEAERVRASLDAATQTEADDAEALAELTERLAAAQTEPAQHEQAVAESTAARDEAAQAASAGRTRETEARLTLRTAEERARAMAGRAQSLERAAAAEREARERAAARERRRAEDARVAHAVHDGAAYTLTVTEQALAAAGDERAAADAARAARESELSAARADAEAQARELAELTDVAHRDEVARAAQVARLEQLHERSTVELGMDPQVLADEFGPDQMVPVLPEPEDGPAVRPYVRAEQEKRLRVAERALNQLGKVNPLALEEFAALEERHKFLVDQLSDLKKSKADLLQIVADIDERVLQVFTAAFLDTQAAFAEIFPRLFPGGEGRLVATDPDDMLTTGIEVEARPAGKKVKRLSLLSGGERSLAAVAMLVAIFKARPSPFYVLDEVEAALDDTNLGRLLGVLRELQSNSQLIVVTHQKRTMEIADALYGVSMRNDGISQIISQRLRESAAA